MSDLTPTSALTLVKTAGKDGGADSTPQDDIENRTVNVDSRNTSRTVGFEELDWSRPSLRGWTIARSNGHKASYVWQYGYRLEDPHGGEWWLCKTCHKGRKGLKHRYRTDKQTSSVVAHLRDTHHTDRSGVIQGPERGKRRRTISEVYGLSRETAPETVNELASAFQTRTFRSLLLQWIVLDNIAFRKVESPHLRSLLRYLNPLCIGELPSHQTLSRWISLTYASFSGLVTERLATAVGQVHFSFDMWTSANSLSLAGVVVHFIDNTGKTWNFLLGLPAHHESHSGYNIAETVGHIIHHWDLQGRIGYFTCDNASNNDTCLDWLSHELGFDAVRRRVRCVGHVINLVAKAVLIGTSESDLDVFEQELDSLAKCEQRALLAWRRRGPVGKLHNIVVFICRSTQRMDSFARLQNAAIDTGRQFGDHVYKLIRDNDTRWNSLFAMIERALSVRSAIDDFIAQQVGKWHEYEARYQQQHSHKTRKPKKRQPPAIMADSLTSEDWDVLAQYHIILKPLAKATVKLQGQVGRHGQMWRVLPTMEQLMDHFEKAKEIYATRAEQARSVNEPAEPQVQFHLKANINLGWQKLDEYYTLTAQCPVYLASVVLHPRYNWSWIQRRWAHHQDWIDTGMTVLQELWSTYKERPDPFAAGLSDSDPSLPCQPRRGDVSGCDISAINRFGEFDCSSDEEDPPLTGTLDQYSAYVSLEVDRGVKDPYMWWWKQRRKWPQLALMALDILTVPPMSDEPERTFSDTGMMVTDRRNRLHSDTINETMALKSWWRHQVVDLTSVEVAGE